MTKAEQKREKARRDRLNMLVDEFAKVARSDNPNLVADIRATFSRLAVKGWEFQELDERPGQFSRRADNPEWHGCLRSYRNGPMDWSRDITR